MRTWNFESTNNQIDNIGTRMFAKQLAVGVLVVAVVGAVMFAHSKLTAATEEVFPTMQDIMETELASEFGETTPEVIEEMTVRRHDAIAPAAFTTSTSYEMMEDDVDVIVVPEDDGVWGCESK